MGEVIACSLVTFTVKCVLIGAVVVGAGAALLNGQGAGASAAASGWTPLMNGKNFDGW